MCEKKAHKKYKIIMGSTPTITIYHQFTVKSAYSVLRQAASTTTFNRASSSYQPPHQLWNTIWKLQIAPKLKIFLWSLCQNALPTKDNLFCRKISANPICTLCSSKQLETVEHLFLCYPWTSQVWSHPQVKVSIQPAEIHRIEEWITNLSTKNQTVPGLELIATLLWQIWKSRNRSIFAQQRPDPFQVVARTLGQVRTAAIVSASVHGIASNRKRPNPSTLWRPPDPGALRLQHCRSRFKPWIFLRLIWSTPTRIGIFSSSLTALCWLKRFGIWTHHHGKSDPWSPRL